MEVRKTTRVRRLLQAVRYDLRSEIPSVPCDAEGNPRVKSFDVGLYKTVGDNVPLLHRTTKLRYRRKESSGRWTAWVDKQDSDTITVPTGLYVQYEIEAYYGGALLTSLGVSTTLDGGMGSKGAQPRTRVWSPDASYMQGQGTEEWYDISLYREDKSKPYERYLCLISHGPRSITPKEDVAQKLGYWALAADFEFIATRLVLAEKITADQIDVDSIFTGTIQANDATINNFNATNVRIQSGTIGGFRITSEGLFNDDENPKATIQIGRDGYRFFHVNPLSAGVEGGYMCQIRGDKLIALKIDGDIGIRVNGYSKSIVSFGNVELTARDTEHISINGLKVNYRWVEDAEVHLKTSDDYIFAGGNARNIYMPSNAKPGKIIYFKAAGFRGQLRGFFRNPNNAGTHWDHGINSDLSRIFIYDGEAWTEFYCG